MIALRYCPVMSPRAPSNAHIGEMERYQIHDKDEAGTEMNSAIQIPCRHDVPDTLHVFAAPHGPSPAKLRHARRNREQQPLSEQDERNPERPGQRHSRHIHRPHPARHDHIHKSH